MKGNTPLRVEELSKRYRIGQKERVHDTMAAALLDFMASPFRNYRRLRELARFAEEPASDVVWALRDVSFEVGCGEVLGVIGKNGAGKTTLLKILSRITHPTRGRVHIAGRVSSLLEVGTGFHPELTGRENVYLNGAILGMTKSEIDRKFDQIVSFSGVERFLDTPVKRYSSGMQVRLAFAVAAHLEPEILLVDEVLAVGDAEFQRKSIGKMRDVTQAGRTVLLVSHNLSAIRNLCQRAILLEAGRLVMDGPADAVVTQYLAPESGDEGCALGAEVLRKQRRMPWGPRIRETLNCHAVKLLDEQGRTRSQFHSDEAVTVSVVFECLEAHNDFRIVVSVVDEDNNVVLTGVNTDHPDQGRFYRPRAGIYEARCVLPPNLFGERRFYVTVHLIFPHVDYILLDRVVAFSVLFNGYNSVQYLNWKESLIRPRLDWDIAPRPSASDAAESFAGGGAVSAFDRRDDGS